MRAGLLLLPLLVLLTLLSGAKCSMPLTRIILVQAQLPAPAPAPTRWRTCKLLYHGLSRSCLVVTRCMLVKVWMG